MTDTGQVPAEGLPENAGMVEQPSVPAHGAYAYLSETTAEDEDLLLLPGAQGAWGNEVPPPVPEPVVETVQEPVPHEPGPHETAGRDSGSVDLGAVRLAEPAPAPVTPRRPLHLGPPLPDTSASPVRSLADRGPAGAPVRQPGPVATSPEYLDAPQLRDLPPQGAAPWGAHSSVAAGVRTAETVAPAPAPTPVPAPVPVAAVAPEPAPEPVGAAQAVVARLATEAVNGGVATAPDAGGAWQGDGRQYAVAQAMTASSASSVHMSTESSGSAGVPELPGAQEAFASDAGFTHGHGQGVEAGPVHGDGLGVESAVVHGDVTGSDPVLPDSTATAVGAPLVQDESPEAAGEAGLAQDGGPVSEADSVQSATGQTSEDVAPVEQGQDQSQSQDQAQGLVFAPGAEQALDADPVHTQEPAPLDGVVAVQEAEATPPVPTGVEPPLGLVAEPVESVEPVEFADAALPAPPADHSTTLAEAAPVPVPVAPVESVEPVPATVAEADPVPPAEAAPALLDAPPSEPVAPQPTAAPEVVAEQHVPAEEVEPVLVPQVFSVEPDVDPEGTPLAQPAAPDAEFVEPAEVPQGVSVSPGPDDSLGRFVPVEGSVPTTPHLAPTPPHPLVLPTEEPSGGPESFAAVPAPREAAADGEPELVQHADDLRTRAADQEEESTAAVADVRESTGPAAPGYDDAEREAVLKVMRERRDIRNGFRSDPIPHDVLLRVLEAAHTAPSVGHSQPWDFVVIRSADTRRTMHELAESQREAYAKSLPKGRAKQFKELKIEAILDTPVNIVVTADPTRGGRHTLGRHTQPQMAPYSAALAVENLWLAARAEGLGVGWVSFFDEREMVRALGLPEHLEVIAYLCVGYVDEFPDEPELMQAGWSKRRPLSWVVHEETYGRRALPGEDPHDLLAETVAGIRPLDAKALGEAWERQKRMTKPPGSLGMLEIISAQLAGLSRQCPPPIPEPAAVAIFAGDHGVHAQGVTPWPQEVTAQMVANFLGGGAVCNAFAGQVGAEVCVVDVGVASELPATPGLLPRKVRAGTSDMTTGPAMTREEAKQAIEVGIETARDLVAAGNKALLTGEMGIANTTASAALISVFTDTDPADVTGRGTGINDETLARKTEVVRRAIELHQPDPADPIGVLAAVGGFEHAAMVGLLLGGASLRTPVILDGVSAGAAALVARAIAPEVLAACIAGHRSAEPGHVAALNKLGLRPLVDLDLRLGEGTGALLALPLVQSTARAMHEVATFDSAGVTEK
ncbi:nicotinate-nucleotide--dimethylbenzimidazole phosphoribosyltransferase [Streptomyces sp. NPDC101175]|uniref:nicotinate-nucleotide--dimethylbenzimidazole phosphoribosyltransferase n=1 Tax=Streptomyces sp. NPDC101175 TaxID=3366123 RepID=UPI00383490C2